ncbi:MAG TPA: CAP domain-containing protein, partial [Candidatus Limnocylindria bacterium]
HYSWGGENIGWNNGYSDGDSPVAIHEGFMASPEHRANILEPSFTHGGVGAYGADNVMFLGKQRSPRFYTELFMEAAGSAPPPPPSGGGGGGSGGGGGAQPPSAGPAASSGGHQKTARNLRVEAPAAPRASDPLDGPRVVAARPSLSVPMGAQEALADPPSGPSVAAAAPPAGSMRIEAADSPERGLFETVLGSLLGFVL